MFRSVRTGGFTLLEMLVVVTIIGILSTIVYMNFGSAGAKGRDAERQSDLRNLQAAIEQFKAKNGRYPAQGCGSAGNWSSESTCPEYIVGLTPEFISRLPRDPRRNGNPGYSYTTNATREVYKLVALQTVESELVTHEHPLKSCDIRVGNTSGSLVSGSSDREVIGWCGRTAQASNNLPASCNAAQAPFRSSYGVWGGFMAKTSDSCPNSNTNCVANTTAIICM